MALSALYSAYGETGLRDKQLPTPLMAIPRDHRDVIISMLINSFNTPLTSSCGRLFDAVAAILGVRQILSYEGQAAMELEALARKSVGNSWKALLAQPHCSTFLLPPGSQDGKWEINCTEFVRMVLNAIAKGRKPSEVALQFHLSLVHSIADLILRLSDQTGIRNVVLSGGCMQNSLMLEGLLQVLNHYKLQVYTGETIPINDGAVSLGQTIIGGLPKLMAIPTISPPTRSQPLMPTESAGKYALM
jgi:hydrogenase maturation protein HypF